MKTLLTALLALSLGGCATLTADAEQSISVVTEPAGASCILANQVGSWSVAKTPGTALVTRSFSPLAIQCKKDGLSGSQTLEAQTRGRAYGNILLLGIPAAVDASTGKGYEYDPENVSIVLK
jgi:hypothetical protein